MSSITVTIDTKQNRIDGLEPAVRLKHKRLVLFLALLLQAKGNPVTFAMLEAACKVQDPGTQLNRTILMRLLDGLEALLRHEQLTSCRLVYAIRNRTVGPWKLHVDKGFEWRVLADTDPVDLTDHVLLAVRVAQGNDWGKVLEMVSRLMRSQSLAQLGFFDDAVAGLDGLLDNPHMSEEFRLWVVLQRADHLRKTNRFHGEVRAILDQAGQQLKSLPHTLQTFMRAYVQYLQAWVNYHCNTANPLGLNHSENAFEDVQAAPNPELISRSCQVRGFWLRRRLDALSGGSVSRPFDATEAVALLRQAMQIHEATLFWALLNRDAFWVQAVLVNWVYLMQKPLSLQVFAQARTFILHGWTLVYVLDDLFNLFDNTYWGEIMLADFWLADAEFRQLAKSDGRIYFNQRFGSPDHMHYYTQLLKLTRHVNDPAQIKAAEAVLQQFREIGGEE